jgi:excisionase family DNA binding protein
MRLGKYLSSLTKPELEEIKCNYMFSDHEMIIIDMLATQKSRVEISNRLCASEPTIDRKIRIIKDKIERCDIMVKVPIWEKMNLSIEEAAEYSNIGINKIYELTNEPTCPFVLWVGKKRVIKRKEFEKFIDKSIEI